MSIILLKKKTLSKLKPKFVHDTSSKSKKIQVVCIIEICYIIVPSEFKINKRANSLIIVKMSLTASHQLQISYIVNSALHVTTFSL